MSNRQQWQKHNETLFPPPSLPLQYSGARAGFGAKTQLRLRRGILSARGGSPQEASLHTVTSAHGLLTCTWARQSLLRVEHAPASGKCAV